MNPKAEAVPQRLHRSRIAAALCAAGVVAIALGGNILGAGAQSEPASIPGESVATTPTQVQASEPATSDPGATTPETSTVPDTATTPDPSDPGSGASAPADPSTHDDDTSTSTTTTTTPAPSAGQAPAAATPAPVPATAPKPAAGTPAASAAPSHELPLGALAGPAGAGKKTADADCTDAAAATTRKSRKTVASIAAGTSDRSARSAQLPACRTQTPATTSSDKTASPDRRADAPDPDKPKATPLRNAEGVPTLTNPTMSLALPGAVPVGVPNFFIDKFRIPPFLLPIYQAAGIQYGIRWEVLAAINEIETDYGRNLNVSSAGALGWMQFMPATWKQYGTDSNRDGRKDPFNPVDAIFAAARYLKAAGADQDLRRAIFAYNHADWYVDSVLMRARLIGGLPNDLIGSLSGLTQGHFPVFAKARYADDISERNATRRVALGQNAAMPVESEVTRRGIDIFAKAGSPAIAVQDGTIVGIGRTKRLGNFVRLRDVYGNTYTYAHLKKVAQNVPIPKATSQSKASIAKELELPKDPKPTRAASAGRPTSERANTAAAAPKATEPTPAMPATTGVAKERLFAHPARPRAMDAGGARQILESESALEAGTTLKSYFTGLYGLDPEDVVLKRLVRGRKVIAGTILGRIGKTDARVSPRLHFEIRPAGRGAPRIDPKPILDGWKLLESTAIYRAQGKNALLGDSGFSASIGQILLMSKDALAQRVLANPRIEIYSCGRRDIEAGGVDRRVLATLEFLAASGLKPTVTSLTCGHGYYTASGNVSAHSSGNAIDIAKVNGIPILGHQGEGSITDITIRRLLTLQGTVKPNQIISLMTYAGTDNTLALGDHADHIHVGFRPQYQEGTPDARQLDAVLKPSQWIKLIDRLGKIDNPTVSAKPSKYAIKVPVERASSSHRGE